MIFQRPNLFDSKTVNSNQKNYNGRFARPLKNFSQKFNMKCQTHIFNDCEFLIRQKSKSIEQKKLIFTS